MARFPNGGPFASAWDVEKNTGVIRSKSVPPACADEHRTHMPRQPIKPTFFIFTTLHDHQSIAGSVSHETCDHNAATTASHFVRADLARPGLEYIRRGTPANTFLTALSIR
jgi:hypothetical protein